MALKKVYLDTLTWYCVELELAIVITVMYNLFYTVSTVPESTG